MLAAGGAAAQTTYPNVKFGGLLQTEFYDYNNSGNTLYNSLGAATLPEDEFFIRRARIVARGNISESVSFLIEPQYSTAPLTTSGFILEQAYVDFSFTKPEAKSAFALRVGQFKRYFGRYELSSSSNLPSIERGTGRGMVPVASNDIATASGFLNLDIGAGLQFMGLKNRLGLYTAVMNGRGGNINDNNNGKSIYARATFAVTPKLSLGASYAGHESLRAGPPVDSSASNTGFGLDAGWGAAGDPGLYVVFDYDNGQTLLDSNNHLYGISLVSAYNIKMKSPTSWLYAVEPAFRYDKSEPNDNAANDQTTLITAGVNLYVSSKAQIRLAYQSQSFEDPNLTTISGLLSAVTFNF
jgi:hypothetical protein